MMDHYLEKIKALVLETVGNEAIGIYLCGKWATDDPSPGDEVEIAFDAGQDMGPYLIMKLRERLEDSNIPFQVDVIDLNRSPSGMRRDDLKKKIVWKNISRITHMKMWTQALASLSEVAHEDFNPIIRDAVIYRFEISFDLCQKSVAQYLRENLNIVCQTQKGCFRQLLTLELTTPDETELLLEMADARNRTVDNYNEFSTSHTTHEKIVGQYYPLMERLAEKIMRDKRVKKL